MTTYFAEIDDDALVLDRVEGERASDLVLRFGQEDHGMREITPAMRLLRDELLRLRTEELRGYANPILRDVAEMADDLLATGIMSAQDHAELKRIARDTLEAIEQPGH